MKKFIKMVTEITKILAGMVILTGITYLLVDHNLDWFVPNRTYSLYEWAALMDGYSMVRATIWKLFDFNVFLCMNGVLFTLLMKIIDKLFEIEKMIEEADEDEAQA